MKNLAYVASQISIGISIFIMIEYPNSGRMSLIAGAMTAIGFASNIVSYLLNSKKVASQKNNTKIIRPINISSCYFFSL